MRNLLKMFGISGALMGLIATVSGADAATGRASYANVRASVNANAAVERMPSMPTLPINSVGNMSPNLPSETPNPTPDPKPDPKPDDPKPDPEPTPECPDGGVKNSTYTVENCMTDILSCVNGGALPGGLNDLFNEDLRNAIVNGMGLCTVQVEKCISTVRRDCKNIYRTSADVWLDFNSRRIQPEYYNFVLRKTGLTPNQAENTCRLLDKNTYGSSFNAVANSGNVTAEYNKRTGAYNKQQGNVLVKNNPQGVQVNDNNPGVDGQRGHYARWDATTADCWLRVAAYNKDSQIKNSWLFGAAGDDKMAETWKQAGDTFTCNKDLFGFSLMNQTSTAAVVGIGGGTLVGAGIGAIAGHGARNFDCSNEGQVKKLGEQLKASGKIAILNEYLDAGNRITGDFKKLDRTQCEDIVALATMYPQLISALDECANVSSVSTKNTWSLTIHWVAPEEKKDEALQAIIDEVFPKCKGKNVQQCADFLAAHCKTGTPACINQLTSEGYIDEKSKNRGNFDVLVKSKEELTGKCTFKPINIAKRNGEMIYCADSETGCKSEPDIRLDANRLGRVLDDLEILNGEKSNMAKSVAIGAGVGAGTGGLATAITAFVERSNINCRVGDGLEQVSFGKSYSIGSLKDFYVKWNLHLPDTVAPTANVVDCATWRSACGTLTDLKQCAAAQVNYQPAGAPTIKLIKAACTPSGSVCIENYPVAVSYGACQE